jgi:hypothetical protein
VFHQGAPFAGEKPRLFEEDRMDDETLLRTAKNGLMLAGHEMGPVGDHWPAIHAITKGMDKEFETYQRDQAVIGEMEFHFADILRDMEEVAATAPPEERKAMHACINEIWSRYYAILEPVDAKFQPKLDDMLEEGSKEAINLRAATQIIKGLGGRA